MKVTIEVSARHVHLSQNDLEILFGKGSKLTPKKDLSQPGQFSCEERVDIIGPKGEIKNVCIIGPTRPNTQVEISLTDTRKLGLTVPIRQSGDIENSPGCKIVGPKGELNLEKGVIVAERHIHLTPEDAKKYNLTNNQIVSVKIDSGARKLTFGDVVVRISESFSTAMHIDTDEANCAAISTGAIGNIIV